MQGRNAQLGLAATIVLAASFAPAADDDTRRAIATLQAVTKEGRGNEDAAPAWKTLVDQGISALFPALEAFDERNPTATNWLRTAVDAIAEKHRATGQKLPATALEEFVKNTRHAPSARRHAYELLLGQDATAKDRLLPGCLNDPSPELRREAIAQELERLEMSARPSIRADLEKLFTYARDKDQVDAIAQKIEDHGGQVRISEHFGFVTHVWLIGPFDSTGGKGFAHAYPPEKARDTTGSFQGKDGPVAWAPFATTDKYGKFDLNELLGKHKDAVAYALAVIQTAKEQPCEIRVTSPTAIKIFLNGQELLAHEEYHHGAAFDAYIGRGTLQPGENVVVLKVCQNNQTQSWAQAWFFQMRICDATGGPLPLEQKVFVDGRTKFVPLGFLAPKEEKK